MTCELCSKTALYRAGNRGFCKAHYQQGVTAQAAFLTAQKAFAIRHATKGGNSMAKGGGPISYVNRPGMGFFSR